MFRKEELEGYTLFDPQKDDEAKIVDAPGNYALLLRHGSELPPCAVKYTPCIVKYEGEEYELIYTGISKSSLRKRDYSTHFNGNNAGRSTLRKSLGSLMRLKKTYRSEAEKSKEKPKIKFIASDEAILSQWMTDNLLLLFKEEANPDRMESDMIRVLNPPLNLAQNSNSVNKAYRDFLKGLRTDLSDLE